MCTSFFTPAELRSKQPVPLKKSVVFIFFLRLFIYFFYLQLLVKLACNVCDVLNFYFECTWDIRNMIE